MGRLRTDQSRGILLGLIGGLVISFDVALIRMAGSDPWVMMAARGGVLAVIFFVFWHLFPRATQTPLHPFENPYWLAVAVLYGVNNVFFTLAVFHTSTANLVFILAFNPMMAALLSWWLIGERPKTATWIAILATICGVGLIVREGLEAGTWLGDFYSLCCAMTLALVITLTRKSGADLSLAPGFGGLVAFAFALPLVIMWSTPPQSYAWLFANAAILVPVAAFCLALAPRFVPAPQAAMFYLLETVLAPVWVWMLFGETVTNMTMAGGAIVLMAICGHSLWQLSHSRRKTVAIGPGTPQVPQQAPVQARVQPGLGA